MKKILLSFAVVMLLGCVNRGTQPTNTTIENAINEELPVNIVLAEDHPPVHKVQVDIGRLNLHQDGYSTGKLTEWMKLKELVFDEKNDIIEISWIWDCSPKYDDMPMKLIYDKINGNLTRVYTKTNVKEEYSGISIGAIQAFLSNKENDIYAIEKYSSDAKYDFNNREMRNEKTGEKPFQEPDGTVKIIADFIKSHISNAKILGWSKVIASGDYWAVRCEYRFDNAAEETITNNIWFYIQNGQVSAIKDNLGNILDISQL